MIFLQKEQIRDRVKTQTRRKVKPGDELLQWVSCFGKRGNLLVKDANGRKKWGENERYAAVPKRGAKRFGDILITKIRREMLHDITEEDAIAEGVNSVEEYMALWESINGNRENVPVWVITFKYLGDA